MIKLFKKLYLFILDFDLFLPVLLLVVYLSFVFILKGEFPTAEELIATFASLYAKYGFEILLISAFSEALVGLNLLVPGQLTMILGIIFAKQGQTNIILVLITIILGALAGYLIDYAIGYLGFSGILDKIGQKGLLNQTQKQLKKFGKRGLILGFVHSNVGALVSLAAGTSKVDFKWFLTLAIISTILWATVWGILIYNFGDIFLDLFTEYSYMLIFVFISLALAGRIWKEWEKR